MQIANPVKISGSNNAAQYMLKFKKDEIFWPKLSKKCLKTVCGSEKVSETEKFFFENSTWGHISNRLKWKGNYYTHWCNPPLWDRVTGDLLCRHSHNSPLCSHTPHSPHI